jgi:hypothetical protein
VDCDAPWPFEVIVGPSGEFSASATGLLVGIASDFELPGQPTTTRKWVREVNYAST